MKSEQIALQLYTLRDQCKTRADFVTTCRRVAEIGYRAVQVSGLDRRTLPEAEIAAICREHGLTICASHESGTEILDDPARVVQRLRALGCRYTAYPHPGDIDFGNEAVVAQLIRRLDEAGRVLAESGLVLCYHNHAVEFQRLAGRLILDRIYAETHPRHLQGEPDTYWVQYGGGNPVEWCARLQGRLPLIHLKDYRISGQKEIEFAEVGAGNLDFPAIIRAAEAAGCRWFIVEQDRCPGDPFESIRRSFDYLQGLTEDRTFAA